MIWSNGINTFTHTAGTRRSDAGFTGCGACFAGGRGFFTVGFDAQASDATAAINWIGNHDRRNGGLGPG